MNFLFKLAKRLSVAHWAHAALIRVLPSEVRLSHSAYLLKAVLLYAMWKGAQMLWRVVRRRLIFGIESLSYPNQRVWCVPADSLRRWTDPDRVKMFNLPRFRAGYPVVYLGLRGPWPVIRRRR